MLRYEYIRIFVCVEILTNATLWMIAWTIAMMAILSTTTMLLVIIKSVLLWSTFDWRLEKDLIGGLKKMAVADLCLGSFLP